MPRQTSNLASRSLAYHAPPTPKFLQALQAQVNSSSRASRSDEFDSLITSSSSSSSKRKPSSSDPDASSDDDLSAAQVVILKEKHLSYDQARQVKGQQRSSQDKPSSKEKEQIASSGSKPKKRRSAIHTSDQGPLTPTGSSKTPLDDVKKLIAQSKPPTPSSKTSSKKKHKPATLSFTLDDE